MKKLIKSKKLLGVRVDIDILKLITVRATLSNLKKQDIIYQMIALYFLKNPMTETEKTLLDSTKLQEVKNGRTKKSF